MLGFTLRLLVCVVRESKAYIDLREGFLNQRREDKAGCRGANNTAVEVDFLDHVSNNLQTMFSAAKEFAPRFEMCFQWLRRKLLRKLMFPAAPLVKGVEQDG